MAAQINVLAFSRRYHHRGANANVLKYTEQLKWLAPVYSSNGNVHSNYFKGANLKRPKIRIVHLSFFNQSSAVTRIVLHLKLPPVAREFSGGGALHFVLSVTAT